MPARLGAALCVAGTVLMLAFGITESHSTEDEMRQVSCGLDDSVLSIGLRIASEIKTAGAHTFLVDFQQEGPVIRLPPEYYAPDWADIEEITFQSIGLTKSEGRLSLKVRGGTGSVYVQPIGVIQRACWNAAKSYLRSNKINRPFKETSE
jgi:hypothetical protein